MDKLISALGQVSAIIGAQWGDEGKGKATDLLAEHFDVIARACGGANAGHTIVVNGEKHIFHLLPSGCLHPGKFIVLGSGMVIHLPTLLEEIDTLKQAGIDVLQSLYISPHAHILLDYHKEADVVLEERRAKQKGEGIGTTKRGIGPAYMDKACRTGLRMELLREDDKVIRAALEEQQEHQKHVHGLTIDVEAEYQNLMAAKAIFFKRLMLNIPELLHTFIEDGKTVLIEGAQATLLDIDHGTYPHVTSSSTTIAGALQGLGIPPTSLDTCIGVAKSYCTRVGGGDFLTEAEGATEERLRERGGEFGATTGRPRRCGWLFLPDLQYGHILNGFTYWNITKLDVLDEEEVIPVGVGFDADGNVVYEHLPGWQSSTVGITSFADLPKNAQNFITHIEECTDVPVGLIGTGPGREDMIVCA